jgi:hypothetical protein
MSLREERWQVVTLGGCPSVLRLTMNFELLVLPIIHPFDSHLSYADPLSLEIVSWLSGIGIFYLFHYFGAKGVTE